MSIIQGNTKVSAGGYEIDQSIRFNDNDSPTLQRTFGSTGGNTWTFSCWMKRGNLGKNLGIFYALPSVNSGIGINPSDQIIVADDGAATYNTTAVFRDPSAWYHIVFTGNGTLNKIYVNNVLQTLSGSPNIGSGINKAVNHKIGEGALGASNGPYMDGYFSEIVFVDGTELSPTDFGETNNDGVWVPKAYAGTYGTNGFYITGEDSADLGKDYSGNGNDFPSSGLTSDDQVTDTPTDNYATLNAVERVNSTVPTIAEGNTYYSRGSTAPGWISATQWLPDSGTYYWETDVSYSLAGAPIGIGVVNNSRTYNQDDSGQDTWFVSGYTSSYLYARADGTTVTNTYIAANPLNTNRLAHAYDGDTGKYWIGLVSGGSITWGNPGAGAGDPSAGTNPLATIADRVRPFVGQWSTSGATRTITATFYFDSTKWNATPPTGFSALSTANLPTPAIKDGSAYFQTTLYTGNGTAIGSGGNAVSQIENSTFQPDFVWIKRRNSTVQHALTDAVRGVTKELNSDALTAESTVAEGLTTFGSAGFTVGSDASYNTSAAPYVAWQWLANGSGSSNEDGSINTTATSVNTAAGISIMTYVGNATAGATIGHGLGKKPGLVIAKTRNSGQRWWVYHEDQGATKYGILELSNAFATSSIYWNNTEPTDTLISLGTGNTNMSGINMLAYAFTEIPGFSKIGAYTGNGNADGAFIYTGFKPAWLMIKRTNSTSSWGISDTKREGYNVDNDFIMADTTAAETTTDYVDLLSNGFKIRNSGTAVGTSGSNYIYMAFAEHPFGGDGVAPATAR